MNATTTPYEIKTAHFSFTCPITGKEIRKGDNYYELDGMAIAWKQDCREGNRNLLDDINNLIHDTMKTLQQELEKRAKEKLSADINALTAAITKACTSSRKLQRIAESVLFTNTKGEQISGAEIYNLLHKALIRTLIEEQLLDDYIEAEVKAFIEAVYPTQKDA